MTARLIMLIGAPGSGKSSYVENILSNIKDKEVVCVNTIRGRLSDDEADQSADEDAWRIARDAVYGNIYAGKTVVLDASNSEGEFRRSLISYLREVFGSKVFIKGIWLRHVPLEACKKRNANRERVLPEQLIEKMFQDLQDDPPCLNEGFDQLYCPSYNGEYSNTT